MVPQVKDRNDEPRKMLQSNLAEDLMNKGA